MVWPEPKEAKADQTTYTIHVYGWSGLEWIPIDGADVRLHINGNSYDLTLSQGQATTLFLDWDANGWEAEWMEDWPNEWFYANPEDHTEHVDSPEFPGTCNEGTFYISSPDNR